jgi:hypothetical protein
MADLEGNLTLRGYDVVWVWQELNETMLDDAQFLFVGSVYATGYDFTDAEVEAIANWFEQGEKTIWVCGDSDYGDAVYGIPNANKILRAIGSKVRVEHTAVQDPDNNCAAAYRPRANVTNTEDAEVASIVAGINVSKGVLFHAPTALYGLVEGTPVSLETTTVRNVYWVMKTGASSTIVDSDFVINPPIVHANGQVGSFVVMVVEKYAGPYGNNKIIVSGENPYGGYQPMFSSEYYGYPLEGPKLVMNAVDWGLMVEYESDEIMDEIDDLASTVTTETGQLTSEINSLKADIEGLRSMTYAAIGVAIIGIVIGAAGVFIKRA